MKVELENVEETYHDCNFCHRKGIKQIISFIKDSGTGISPNICFECLEELYSKAKDLKLLNSRKKFDGEYEIELAKGGFMDIKFLISYFHKLCEIKKIRFSNFNAFLFSTQKEAVANLKIFDGTNKEVYYSECYMDDNGTRVIGLYQIKIKNNDNRN